MSILIIGAESSITDAIALALVELGLVPVTVITTLSEFVKSVRKNGKWGENVPIFVLYLPESLSNTEVDDISTAIGVLGDVIGLDLDIRKPVERIAVICRICREMSP